MCKVIVCDDELRVCEMLVNRLHRFSKECSIPLDITVCNSGKELLDMGTADADILLLDIQMEPVSGMEAAHIIRKTNQDICIIFITTMVQYAIEGYQVHAFGFVRKPVHYAQLKLLLLDCIRTIRSRSRDMISLKSGNDTVRVDVSQLMYCEIYGHNIDLVTTTEKITYYGTLATLEQTLKNKNFFRCHKSYLVGMKFIQKVTGFQIQMTDSSVISVSKYRKKELMETFALYNGGIVR